MKNRIRKWLLGDLYKEIAEIRHELEAMTDGFTDEIDEKLGDLERQVEKVTDLAEENENELTDTNQNHQDVLNRVEAVEKILKSMFNEDPMGDGDEPTVHP